MQGGVDLSLPKPSSSERPGSTRLVALSAGVTGGDLAITSLRTCRFRAAAPPCLSGYGRSSRRSAQHA